MLKNLFRATAYHGTPPAGATLAAIAAAKLGVPIEVVIGGAALVASVGQTVLERVNTRRKARRAVRG